MGPVTTVSCIAQEGRIFSSRDFFKERLRVHNALRVFVCTFVLLYKEKDEEVTVLSASSLVPQTDAMASVQV